jgi:peptide/nickel transport system substrate-binding protein
MPSMLSSDSAKRRLQTILTALLAALLAIGASAQKEIVVAQADNLETVDVHMQGNMTDMAVLINMFDTLLTRDQRGDIQPNLATSWQAIGGTTWQFKLREDVTFHNGEKLNAETVKFSIERVMDPEQQSPIQEFRTFESVEVVDEYTVNIHTSVVDPMVPAKLTLFGGAIVPKQYIEENGDQYFAEIPVGSGPFRFVEWVKDDRLVLERNPDYWQGPAELDRVTFVGIPNAASRVSALLTGEVDIVTQVTADFFSTIENNSDTRIDSTEGLRIYYLSTASPDGPTSDARVRQAISHAIDTQLLIDELAGGQGTQIAAPVATANFGYNPNLRPYEYDPERARELLATAGYGDGLTIDFATRPGIYEDLAVAITGMLEEVGIKANLTRLPPGQFEEQYSRGELPPVWNLGYTLWQGEPSVLIETFFLTGNPRAKFSTPELDQLIRDLQSEVETEARRLLIQQALQILHNQAPWTYLYQANEVFGVNERVEWTTPNNQILNMYKVDIVD